MLEERTTRGPESWTTGQRRLDVLIAAKLDLLRYNTVMSIWNGKFRY